MMGEEKRAKIKQTKAETKARREGKVARVYKVKIDRSHLSKTRYHHLKMLFVEAKWLYNHMVATDTIFTHDYKQKNVYVKNKDGEIEERWIKHLSSQMRQSLVDRARENIYNLGKAKQTGRKVGSIQFKSDVFSVPLKQHSPKGTFNVVSKNRIKLQGMKTPIHVRGLKQLGEDPDIANAHIVKHIDDFYFHITVYEKTKERKKTGKQVGLDLGIKDAVITSDGSKFTINAQETPRLKKLQGRLHRRTKKGSNNRYKLRKQIQKEYTKVANKKDDIANKIIHQLHEEYDFIGFQNESIRAWQSGRFGRSVQSSILGRIKSALKRSETAVMVNQFFPSTQECPVCHEKQAMTLGDRWYYCDCCGYSEDRDVKAAISILNEALKIAGREPISLMPVEGDASINTENSCNHSVPTSVYPEKQEANEFIRW